MKQNKLDYKNNNDLSESSLVSLVSLDSRDMRYANGHDIHERLKTYMYMYTYNIVILQQ